MLVQNMRPLRLKLSDDVPQTMNAIPVDIINLDTRIQQVAGSPSGELLRYDAIVSQSETDNPSVTELMNTTGADITWARDDVGQYTISATSGVFVIGRTQIFISPNRFLDNAIIARSTNPSAFLVETFDGGVAADDILLFTSVSILVWPEEE